MVQSSRLKKRTPPIFSILLVLILLTVFGYFAYPTLKERVQNTFAKYENKRAELISKYNDNVNRIDTLLLSNHKSIGDFETKLKEAKFLLESQTALLNEISRLNLNSLQKTTDTTQYSTIQLNMAQDSMKLSRSEYLANEVKEKIEAINMYNIIKSFDSCIRKVKDKHDILKCENIYLQIKNPAVPSTNFKGYWATLFVKYFELSKSERSRLINSMVTEQNKMIKSLEKIINKPITVQ